MNKVIPILILSLYILLTGCNVLEEPVMQELPHDYKAHLVAHRGIWRKDGNRENSYHSVLDAAKSGVWGAEIDVRETADGQIILNHDRELFGMNIDETDYHTFLEYTFSNGEKISILPDVLEILKKYPEFHLQIEVKYGSASHISKCIDEAHVKGQIIIISFEKDICDDFLENTDFPVMLLCHTEQDFDARELKEKGFYGVSMGYPAAMYDNSALSECHKYGLKMCVWTPDNVWEIACLLTSGIDFVTTNISEDLTYEALKEAI